MQCVFFEKVYNGAWGKAPEAREFSRIFVLKANFLVVFCFFYNKK